MKAIKIFWVSCLAVLFTIGMNACSKSNDANPTPATTDNLATIQGMQFMPATITVLLGSRTTWTNMDATAHTVTSDDGTSFSSGTISPQGTFSFTATQLGSYHYHCSIHPTEQGIVQVVTR